MLELGEREELQELFLPHHPIVGKSEVCFVVVVVVVFAISITILSPSESQESISVFPSDISPIVIFTCLFTPFSFIIT